MLISVLAESSEWRAGEPLSGIETVRFSPDSKYLAAAGDESKIWVNFVALSSVIVTFSSHLQVWEIGKRRIRNIFNGHRYIIWSLDFSHNGKAIVSGSSDCTVRVWNMQTGTSKVFTDSESQIFSVSFSPDGQYIAAGTGHEVLMWDVRKGGLVERLNVHTSFVCGVTFTPDGKRLVTGSRDKTLKVWDITLLSLGQPCLADGQQDSRVDDVDKKGKIMEYLLDFEDPVCVHAFL